jgi:hypothetical protein
MCAVERAYAFWEVGGEGEESEDENELCAHG